MDASISGWVTLFLSFIVALISYIYTRDSNRVNTRLDSGDHRLNNHAQRLTKLDGQIEEK